MSNINSILIKSYVWLAISLIMSIIAVLFYFVLSRGYSYLSLDFLLLNPTGVILGEAGGIRNAIIGSFLLMSLSIVFSAALGISCAFYRIIFCENRFIMTALQFIVQSMAAIPSILLGLFVYGFFIVSLNLPKSLFTASFTLALMVFPFVEISTEKVLKEIESTILRDSFALGIDKNYMCQYLVLPLIKTNIVSILILAGSYAIGATAPLLLTGVVFMAEPQGLFSPVMALPFHLHMLLNQSVATEAAYATALVLMGILVALHCLAYLVLNHIGVKLVYYFKDRKFVHWLPK